MDYIDYGLSVLTRNVIVDNVAPGQVAEVFERFYEVGSPEGLSDFEKYIASSEDSVNCGRV
jgi:hypothetical protein